MSALKLSKQGGISELDAIVKVTKISIWNISDIKTAALIIWQE